MISTQYSIAIPVYERIYGFEEALNSALQVNECNEIIICDDCSPNSILFKNILNRFTDKRIRYYRNEYNIGLFNNWNNCIQLASGEYISILCSDDLIAPNIFQLFEIARNNSDEIDVFFGTFSTFHQSTDDAKIVKQFPEGRVDSEWLFRDLADKGPGFPVLTIAKRSKLLKYPFIGSPHSGNDWLWIYSNASKLNLYACKYPLSYWRRHEDQDAVKRQAITQDCWPMMYDNASKAVLNPNISSKLKRRAVGFLLSCLINDKVSKGFWYNKLSRGEDFFMARAKEICLSNWLLSRIIAERRFWPVYYNLGRLFRKAGIYPS